MWQIVRRNLLSPIVFIISALVAVLFTIHQRSDAFFLSATIVINAILGIAQELRARHALRRLELLNAPVARRITETGIEMVSPGQLLIGDLLSIELGDQIPADGVVVRSHSLQVNEALITGEAREIAKQTGSFVFAGSFVMSGESEVRITALGSHSKMGEMGQRLKQYAEKVSPLQRSLSSLITYLTYAALAVSLLIFLTGHQKHSPLNIIINTVIAGAISIVPEGIILASTLLLSLGALKMARTGVIIQRLTAIEGLSRLDTLCLDKTGTLTTNKLILESYIPLNATLKELSMALSMLVHAETHPNATLKAIASEIRPLSSTRVLESLAFTSSRKWSAVLAEYSNSTKCLALGSPEALCRAYPLPRSISQTIHSYTRSGKRVLLVMDYGNPCSDDGEVVLSTLSEYKGTPIGLVVMNQELRPNIVDTLFYLQAQGVCIKVLSGDAPRTVQFVAHQAGVLHSEKVISGDELALINRKEWPRVVREYTVFARILPEQKEMIITTLQDMGFVGMVGDGVNDALAIKKADLGIAMFDGSAAARQVADIVLVNNDFSIFPHGMRIGSQIILGLELVTGSYFNRIIASLTILFLCLFLNLPYPFFPSHLVILNLITVAIPSIAWSLFPPETTQRYDPRKFFTDTWKFALPNGLITGLAVLVGYILARHIFSGNVTLARSMAVTVIQGLGIFSFTLLPSALHAIDSSQLRKWQLGYSIVLPLVLIYLSTLPRYQLFFHLVPLGLTGWAYALAIIVIAGSLQLAYHRRPVKYDI
jgi:cation-transporting ATPase E